MSWMRAKSFDRIDLGPPLPASRICPFDRALEDPDAGRTDMGALPAADAMVDTAGNERRGSPIGPVARVQGESCELHHRCRTHEPLAVRGARRHAQHALDAVHGVGRCRELGSGDRFREAAVGSLALHPWLERAHVGEVPRSVDHEVPDDRKAGERPDDHLGLDWFPAPQSLASVDHHPAHAALLDAAEPLVGKALAELLDHVVEGFENTHFPGAGDLVGLETRGGIAARIVLLDRQGDGVADPQIGHARSASPDRGRRPDIDDSIFAWLHSVISAQPRCTPPIRTLELAAECT